jgi:hypothetical protein
MTTTLHIEHQIHDFDLWKGAFAGLADARERAGVIAHRIAQPVGDAHQVVIDLDFARADQAEQFLTFLQTQIWTSSEKSPALAGGISTMLLDLTDV